MVLLIVLITLSLMALGAITVIFVRLRAIKSHVPMAPSPAQHQAARKEYHDFQSTALQIQRTTKQSTDLVRQERLRLVAEMRKDGG